jgi:hypothetical protein
MEWLEGEPTLEEVLSDPTIHVLMARDEVNPDDLRVLLEDMKNALEGCRTDGGVHQVAQYGSGGAPLDHGRIEGASAAGLLRRSLDR